MREVELSDGSKRQVRALTRGEIRALKELGVKSVRFDVPLEKYDEVSDAVLKTQVEFETLGEPDCRKLFTAILAETYSDPGEEKNSLKSGPSAQTKPEENTAPVPAQPNTGS